MKKNLKMFLEIFGAILVLAGNNLNASAYCNSPCPNPCTPSQTVCEGTNCTTYCNTNSKHYSYTTPGVSFSYSTPNISFSVSNELYASYYRPGFRINTSLRPIYRKKYHPKPAFKRPPVANGKPIHKKPKHG